MYATPNTVMRGDGFWVSHNDVDTAIYGCVTTALVIAPTGDPVCFLILCGDHRGGYRHLIGDGLAACVGYYKEVFHLAHKMSEPIPEEFA